MSNSNAGPGGDLVEATVTFSPAAAGALTAASATLNAGATGTPSYIGAVGNVNGYLSLTVLGQQTITVPFSANAPPQYRPIPAKFFPTAINSVSVGGYAAAAGSIAAIVGFRLK